MVGLKGRRGARQVMGIAFNRARAQARGSLRIPKHRPYRMPQVGVVS